MSEAREMNLLREMVRLLRGPKMSDKKLCAALGVSHEEAFRLIQRIREIHGVSSLVPLRAALKSISLQ